ncbi:phosphonate C-P lyase system protein PhnG [Dorea formicigenerans]|uniref:phosphonate C-P lyase system protein PhnG n=1 Tax=Dorea formicigenerans TaxID=39486 RepID=UPI00156FE406|nr:phosphonate C-P lyase system protein PhnG [Dorea formicigenerans]NSK20440.1 phosphonate C-P lyase system protein PhnG [Dorea formicigenerans]
MLKRKLSAILAGASKDELAVIADQIKSENNIKILKEPQKTLVMVKVRESVKNSLFYLGEVLATECMVTVDGTKGVSVIAGDDFEKAIAAAIIDGYLNGEGEKKDVLRQIDELGKRQRKSREAINRQLRKSKVNFNVMGE